MSFGPVHRWLSRRGTVAFFVARQSTALGLAPLVIDAHEVRES